MVIMHNLVAMNGNRMLGINNKKKASVTEKLSSGYKINRAADDAAGLAISEKMRRQIRGLSQASINAQDGISLMQVADGAMSEVHEMLARGTELSIKAATGTLTEQDRKFIQEEMEQLEREIDALSERTTFNDIQVLKGDQIIPATVSQGNAIIKGGFPGWATIEGVTDGYMSGSYTTQETFQPTSGTSSTHDITHEAVTIDFTQYDGSQDKKNELIGQGFYTTCCTCSNHYSIRFTADTGNSREQSGDHFIYNIGLGGINTADQLVDAIVAGTTTGTMDGVPEGHYTVFAEHKDNAKKLVVYDVRSNADNPKAGVSGEWTGWGNGHHYYTSGFSGWNTTAGEWKGYGTFGPGVAYDGEDFEEVRQPGNLYIQIGAEAGEHLDIELPEISSLALGVDTVDLSTQEGATKAISIFKKATGYVNTERSRMGAYQNRLEHTIKSLDNVVENTTAAESQIRDVDMAKAMVEFSNLNVLQQAGQSVLAQANQNNQGVLSLLQ